MADKHCAEKIWRIRTLDGSVDRLLVGNDLEKIKEQARGLTGQPESGMLIEDTGKTKPCCEDCGKKGK